MRSFLGENDMMAYLAMMAVRLLELHCVLKPTGSLDLHCDPTASHYLKILLDAVFGAKQFTNEIVWLRANSHKFKTSFWPRQHDAAYGPPKTLYNRFIRWSRIGVFDRVFATLAAAAALRWHDEAVARIPICGSS